MKKFLLPIGFVLKGMPVSKERCLVQSLSWARKKAFLLFFPYGLLKNRINLALTIVTFLVALSVNLVVGGGEARSADGEKLKDSPAVKIPQETTHSLSIMKGEPSQNSVNMPDNPFPKKVPSLPQGKESHDQMASSLLCRISGAYVFPKDLTPAFDRRFETLLSPSHLPKMYRSSSNPFLPERLSKIGKYEETCFGPSPGNRRDVSKLGLAELHLSASAQYTPEEAHAIVQKILRNEPSIKKIVFIDLRRESHGFINNLPFHGRVPGSSGNAELQDSGILEEERKWLNSLKTQPTVSIADIITKEAGCIAQGDALHMTPLTIQSEEEVIKSLDAAYGEVDITYRRFFFPDHKRPSDATVDEVVAFFESVDPATTYLHVHCAGGKGRASQYFIMFDIFRNRESPSVALKDFFARHYLIGGKYLPHISKEEGALWKVEEAQNRYQFLKEFYGYITSPDGYAAGLPWSRWVHLKKD